MFGIINAANLASYLSSFGVNGAVVRSSSTYYNAVLSYFNDFINSHGMVTKYVVLNGVFGTVKKPVGRGNLDQRRGHQPGGDLQPRRIQHRSHHRHSVEFSRLLSFGRVVRKAQGLADPFFDQRGVWPHDLQLFG